MPEDGQRVGDVLNSSPDHATALVPLRLGGSNRFAGQHTYCVRCPSAFLLGVIRPTPVAI